MVYDRNWDMSDVEAFAAHPPTEQVPQQTTPEHREELARLASEATNGNLNDPETHRCIRAYLKIVHDPAKITAVLADLAAAEAECQRLERDIRCETPDPCEGCEDEYEGDGAPGCSTCHNNCERFDAYAKTATFRMKTAEIDGRCHFEAASQLEAECQRVRGERDLWKSATVKLAYCGSANCGRHCPVLGKCVPIEQVWTLGGGGSDCECAKARVEWAMEQARAALGVAQQGEDDADHGGYDEEEKPYNACDCCGKPMIDDTEIGCGTCYPCQAEIARLSEEAPDAT